jgi:hypothetical protein
MEKGLFITIGIIIVAIGAIVGTVYFTGGFGNNVQPTPAPQGIILFYGDGCPHCKNVDDFIAQNKIDEKIKITKLEVWHNQANAKLLTQKAEECKLDISNGIPIPFLYDGAGKCYIGEVDIPNFLKNEK